MNFLEKILCASLGLMWLAMFAFVVALCFVF